MALREELERTGEWLFSWRSYLPLFLAIPMLAAMAQFQRSMASHRFHEMWESISLIVAFCGLGLRVITVAHVPSGTSGRNTRQQVARELNTTGIYSVVRHPLYVGNFLVWIGVSMFWHTWWLTAIFALVFWIYYERIMFAEEEFLRRKFGNAFVEWAAKTPLFIPRLSNWKPPARPFSLRRVLTREYSSLFAVVSVFVTLELAEHWLIDRRFDLDAFWISFGGLGLTIYVVLRTLRQHTSLLKTHRSPRQGLANGRCGQPPYSQFGRSTDTGPAAGTG